MTEQEIVIMAAEVAAKAAVAAVRAILGKEIQESVEAAVTDAARLGAEASIKAVEQERKKFRDGRSDRRFRNTKLLLRNYTVLNANCSHAVYDAASAATGEESVEEIVEALDELLEENLKVESIMKSAAYHAPCEQDARNLQGRLRKQRRRGRAEALPRYRSPLPERPAALTDGRSGAGKNRQADGLQGCGRGLRYTLRPDFRH